MCGGEGGKGKLCHATSGTPKGSHKCDPKKLDFLSTTLDTVLAKAIDTI